MFAKIVSFFMTVVAFFASLFGFSIGKDDGAKKEMLTYNDRKTAVVLSIKENPSTGNQWEYTIANEKVIKVTNDRFINTAPEGVVGAGGIREITFSGIRKGSSKVTLIYHRPWEKDTAPLETITLLITVADDMTVNAEIL